jgi:NADPH2:quinone reductase
VISQLTGGRGVDVILDMVAGSYVPREIACLANDGRLAIIALLGGASAEVDLSTVLRRRLTLTGSTLRPRSIAFKAAIAHRLRAVVWPLIEAGRIRPIVHATFPLGEASSAHALMESSQHIGKIVLTVDADAGIPSARVAARGAAAN